MTSTSAGAIIQLLSGAAVSSETSAGLLTAVQGMQATASGLLVSLAGHPGLFSDVDRGQLELIGTQLQNARKELRWLRETSVR